jgi:hypothetical protein
VEKALIEDCKSNMLIDIFIERPCQCLSFAIIICIVLSTIAVLVNFLALDDLGDRDFLIWDDPTTKNYDMWRLARTYKT